MPLDPATSARASHRARRRRRSGAILGALALTGALACAWPAAADDDNTRYDGLNADLRGSLYNADTALVARLDLTQLGHDQIVQTFRGMFDPDELAVAEGRAPGFEKGFVSALDGPTALVAGLVEVNYKALTVAVLQYQGPQVFGALSLGFNLDEVVFQGLKLTLEGIFSANGFSVELTRRGDYVLIHGPNAGLPPVDHSQSVEDAVLLGLQQGKGTPAAILTAPVSDSVKAQLAAAPVDAGPLPAAIADADYVGGYMITGDRPEIHLYLRYGSEAKANGVKALYDKYLQDRIATAAANDEAEATGKTLIVMRSVLTGAETERRIAAASGLTVFNNTVRLDLDTPRLREITGTLIERYYRKPPDDDASKSPAPTGPSGSPAAGSQGAPPAPSDPAPAPASP